MEPKVHTYFKNVLIAFVPDLVVAWAFMRLTNDETASFWYALLGLQVIYFFLWPAPGSEDTELGVLMEPEVRHGEAEVYARVQA